jgi:hypothetical protein
LRNYSKHRLAFIDWQVGQKLCHLLPALEAKRRRKLRRQPPGGTKNSPYALRKGSAVVEREAVRLHFQA